MLVILFVLDDETFLDKFIEFGMRQALNWDLPSTHAIRGNDFED